MQSHTLRKMFSHIDAIIDDHAHMVLITDGEGRTRNIEKFLERGTFLANLYDRHMTVPDRLLQTHEIVFAWWQEFTTCDKVHREIQRHGGERANLDHPHTADPGCHVILLFLDHDQPGNLAQDPSQHACDARILGTCVQPASASQRACDAYLELT